MELPSNVRDLLSASTDNERIICLRAMQSHKESLPIGLAQDLMLLGLSEMVQREMLAVVQDNDRLALEDFLTRGIFHWSQNVTSIALHVWSERTDGVLWHRPLALAHTQNLPQRVAYTLLDLAWHTGGELIIRRFLDQAELGDRSPAFVALLLQRAVEWNIDHPVLRERAKLNQGEPVLQSDKDTIFKILYAAVYTPEELKNISVTSGNFDFWSDLARQMKPPLSRSSSQVTPQIATASSLPDLIIELEKNWPMLWQRQYLSAQTIYAALETLCKLGDELHRAVRRDLWRMFGGALQHTLVEAMGLCQHPLIFSSSVNILGNLLTPESLAEVFARAHSIFTEKDKIPGIMKWLPDSCLIDQADLSIDERRVLAMISSERQHFSAEKIKSAPLTFTANFMNKTGTTVNNEETNRRHFFAHVYEHEENLHPHAGSFWGMLVDACAAPKESMLDDLSIAARKAPKIFHLAYIDVLGKFRGIDKAALKLLDYVRSDDESTGIAVVRALAGIGTERALQEMVSFLTRPNATADIQHEIINFLTHANLNKLQNELRSAVHDLEARGNGSKIEHDVLDALIGLITPETSASNHKHSADVSDAASSEALDQVLQQKIHGYNELSSETRRALRTALFFHQLVEDSDRAQTIDLSPAIDMQYKAMELIFRESFENHVTNLMNKGVLQRKLDVIGYARPIPQKMDEFERFIEALPIINTIPFFSKFKLEKMLKSMCQYYPGKRFTLDGLKAFALFFLCFSRKECRYGLANQFPIPNINDNELYSFVKDLHMFQDFRNRAAHEGFHPEKSNDIDSLWNYTIKIVATVARMKEPPGFGPAALSSPRQSENAHTTPAKYKKAS